VKKSRIRKKSPVKSLMGLFGAGSLTLFSTAAVAGALSLVYAALEMPDSLVAKWLVRPLAIASVGTVSASGGLPTGVGSSTSVTNPASVALKPMKLGINLAPPTYYGTHTVFMNLAADSGWYVHPAGGGSTDSYFDANRNVVKVLPGDQISRALMRPSAYYQKKSVDVTCKWDGVGTLSVLKLGIVNLVMGTNSMRYTQLYDGVEGGRSAIYLQSVDPNNPVRNMDCREVGASPTALFDPVFLANVKRYSTIRFMDWQNINANLPTTWAKRTTPAMGQIMGVDGMPIEHMIALANQTHTNPWFCMPWNADDDYVRRFAQLVRDTLDPDLKVYVEASNEVWNWGFPVTTQAQQEGLQSGLTADGQVAVWLRYAEKTIQVMDIWKQEFAGQNTRLVRVAASLNAWSLPIQKILEFRDTPQHIDAVASAPYFEYDVATITASTDLKTVFATLKMTLDARLDQAKAFKQFADQYNLRFITYEAGQHMANVPNDYRVQLLSDIQHDQRMGQLYTHYMTRWNNEIGDLMMLFNDYGLVSQFGAWGMLDYGGQAANATPKSKAVQLFQASISK
jgi:hypothetical protein